MDLAPSTAATASELRPGSTLFGHPRGLTTLFLTEMWERFSHYGMRAILVLFMVTAAAHGGLGIGDRAANSIYGLFVATSYLSADAAEFFCLPPDRTLIMGSRIEV